MSRGGRIVGEVRGAYAGFSAAHEALDVLSEIVTPG